MTDHKKPIENGVNAKPGEAGRDLRVLVADDHSVMRDGLASLLSDVDGIEVVGQAGDGREALAEIHRLEPDVAVVDVSMPLMDGIELTRRLREEHRGVQVVGLSMFEEKQVARQMLDAGAVAYLVKSGPVEALVSSVLACGGTRGRKE